MDNLDDQSTAGRAARGDQASGANFRDSDIAVIGMACRFPGANDLHEYWGLIESGSNAISRFSIDELRGLGIPADRLDDPAYVPAKGVLRDADCFDAEFFGYSPAEARRIDPQQRVFLECAWHAIEDAGYDPKSLEGSVGVYGGSRFNSYAFSVMRDASDPSDLDDLEFLAGNDKDYLAPRVSYKLGLRGASVTVQTACSSSLVSVVMAARSLQTYDNDVALAGGVRVSLPLQSGYVHEEGSILSADGVCRPFDAGSSGTVFGDGAGVVVLKRLGDAIRDGDNIRAVLRGCGINNDGALRNTFTAPAIEGQVDVIVRAIEDAEVSAQEIGYVECHGTGTQLGDPIEIAALQQAFQRYGSRRQACPIGAVKGNLGHLSAAAGIASFIKVVLMLERGRLPPLANFSSPNPHIDLARTSFVIPTQGAAWQRNDGPRMAGVSSFGFGGTNAHVILQEGPDGRLPAAGPLRVPQILPLSAPSADRLAQLASNMAARIRSEGSGSLSDIACTLQDSRGSMPFRRAVVAIDHEHAAAGFQDGGSSWTGSVDGPVPEVVFLFPGQGERIAGAAASLVTASEAFTQALNEAIGAFEPLIGETVYRYLTSSAASAAGAATDTNLTQPAIFAFEYALASTLIGAGVSPALMIGHSLGELVAACVGGVFSLPVCAGLVALRGTLMQDCQPGAMIAVAVSETEAKQLANNSLAVAAVNAPELTVLAGETNSIDDLAHRLAGMGIAHWRLATNRAFHSPMMAAAGRRFSDAVGIHRAGPANLPYVSTISGALVSADTHDLPEQWGRQFTATVQFHKALQVALERPGRIYLELGPSDTLTRLLQIGSTGTAVKDSFSIAAPAGNTMEGGNVAAAIARLWCRGIHVSWDKLRSRDHFHRVPLPLTPMERTRCWLDHPLPANTRKAGDTPSAGAADTAAKLLYVPVWEPVTERQAAPSGKSRNVLVFIQNEALGAGLAARLQRLGHSVIPIQLLRANHGRAGKPGESILLGDPQEFVRLAQQLRHDQFAIDLIAFAAHDPASDADTESLLGAGFDVLVGIANAFVAEVDIPPRLVTLTRGAMAADAASGTKPGLATLLGPSRVLPQEYPGAHCILLDLPHDATDVDDVVVAAVLEVKEPVVAVRNGKLLCPRFRRAGGALQPASRLRRGGTYLITGGLGGMGLTLATHIAKAFGGNFVLLGRDGLPPKDEWRHHLERNSSTNLCTRIRAVQAIEALGCKVVVNAADVSDLDQLHRAVETGVQSFGAINGVIHAAGIAGGSMLATIGEHSRQVIRPKVQGTVNLLSLFPAGTVDFIALCSSHNSLLGRIGQADYSAANAFMDSAASAAPERSDVISIGWGVWKDVGMAAQTLVPEELRAWRHHTHATGITAEEGAEVFSAIMRLTHHPHVVVSPVDFNDLYADNSNAERTRLGGMLGQLASSKPRRESEAERAQFSPPTTPMEIEISELWAEVLGVEKIGLDDSFLKLGGHSLVAIVFISKLRKRTGRQIALRDFMKEPTIRSVCKLLEDPPQGSSAPLAPAIAKVDRSSFAAGGASTLGVTPNSARLSVAPPNAASALGFSLFFFSASDRRNEVAGKYDLLHRAAKFADENGFQAIWVPERHFNSFGGLYPNPAVVCASLAAITQRVSLRAGSVILPLNNSTRVAEDWAVVDHLSNGRVGVAFGSGWHVNDFVLAPHVYRDRKDAMIREIETVARLWRGDEVLLPNGAGKDTPVRIYPRPLQASLPMWITAESRDSFILAGRVGASVLTALLHQNVKSLEENIRAYREAYASHGHAQGKAHVTLMQHTFVWETDERARELAFPSYSDYVRTNLVLQATNVGGIEGAVTAFPDDDVADIARAAFDRLAAEGGLIGSVDTCRDRIRRLNAIGVDEVACLVDFVIDDGQAIEMLSYLNRVRRAHQDCH